MKRFCPFLITLALTGCLNPDGQPDPAGENKLHTVDDFIAQPKLRAEFAKACSNNPGQIGATANCINVRRAEHIAAAGTSIPSFVNQE